MDQLCAVILCAGKGIRMKSKQPKGMKEVLFKPMLAWILDTLSGCGVSHICTVVPDNEPEMAALAQQHGTAVVQRECRGTASAVLEARAFWSKYEDVLILHGDAPLVDEQTIRDAYRLYQEEGCAACVVTSEQENPAGYGRILRDGRSVHAIVEERDADDTTKKVREVNAGTWVARSSLLGKALPGIRPANAQGELYLTDLALSLQQMGETVLPSLSANPDILKGANGKAGLHALNEAARMAVLHRHMQNGVEIPCLDGVLIGPDVVIGPDTLILPGTILRGSCHIGAGCEIGPNTMVCDSRVGDGVRLNASQVSQSEILSHAKIGPFCHLRPGTRIGEGVKLGDFVEVKNSTIGERTSVAHLTYIGDSDVGQSVNFGGGCITVNYDGREKHRTTVCDHAFIGCNTNLVAPVSVGEGAFIAAGSTITDDIEAQALAIARARQTQKPGWARVWFSKRGC